MVENDELQQKALSSVQSVYRECAKLLLSANVTEKQHSEMARRAYIEEAIAEQKTEQINYRDIERKTGLNRQTAEKLVAEIKSQEPIRSRRNAFSVVLAYWYANRRQYPLQIPLVGQYSFKELCQNSLTEIRSAGYKSMLIALIETESINFNELNQTVTLVSKFPVYKNISYDSIDIGYKKHLTYHAHTIANNLLSDDKLPEKIYRSYCIPDELLPKFKKQLSNYSDEFMEKSAKFIVDECETNTIQSKVVGIGLYLFELPTKNE